ncbi:MAG: hypothetical protein JWO05_1526 [Gemmatimonadetes bacterium]|nr:hypothetical protein [Gemmatimonadota bacterium]
MSHSPNEHQDRFAPADTDAGWPIASGVILLAIACIVTVTIIHKKTYLHPTNTSFHAAGTTTPAEH